MCFFVLDALAHRKVDPRAHHFVTCRGVAKSVPFPTDHAPLCEPIRFLRDSILGRDSWGAEERLHEGNAVSYRFFAPRSSDYFASQFVPAPRSVGPKEHALVGFLVHDSEVAATVELTYAFVAHVLQNL